MMLSTISTPTITTSPVHTPKKKGTKSNNTSPKIKKEPGTIIKSKTIKKTTKKDVFDGESLQLILKRKIMIDNIYIFRILID
ncbi:unnamed protein product [Rotaria sp. Silwood2]|nr:unnamed protein product [Rotaria sp. Silwood2]